MKPRVLEALLAIPFVLLPAVPVAGGQEAAEKTDAVLEELLQAPRPEVKLEADDMISVQVFPVKEYAFEQRISRDGTVQLPLLGKVHLAGLTVQEGETQIATGLKSGGYLQDPQVNMRVLAQPSALITVTGSVVKPGVIPAYGRRTVADCLSESGGLIEYVPSTSVGSSLGSKIVTLIRPSLKEPVRIPLGADPQRARYGQIPVFAGDEIHVGKAGIVYAVGAFKSQGGFSLKSESPTTILQLMALAGGVGFEGRRDDARILRVVDGKRQIVNIDVAGILKGKVADIALQPDDVLFVPTNQMRAAIKGGGTGLIISIVSAYLYSSR